MNVNIFAGVRKDKQDAKGFVPIYIYVYEGRKLISKVSFGRKVHVDLWDLTTKQVSKKHPDAMLLNAVINKRISELNIKAIGQELAGTLDLSTLIEREKVNEINFYEFAEKQIKEKNYASETRRAYQIVIDKMKVHRKYLKISEIDYKFLQGFETYLRVELKNDVNTVWGNFKVINTFTNDAIKFKYILVDPFSTYQRPRYKQTDRSFLNAGELKLIEDLNANTLDFGVKQVCNYFLFMCYTGLRFSDAIRFKADEHIKDNNRIILETQKTKKVTNLFINDKITPLIEFITANPFLITQQYFNRQLKLIADHLKIKKKVSSHVARHSFGTALAALGVPEKVAQGLLAHGSAASTKIYYHLEQHSLDAAMKKFND